VTKDALKKFRTNRQRGVDAIAKLKIDGLEIKSSGVSLIANTNANVQQFPQPVRNRQQMSGQSTFSETLSFNIPGIDRLTDEQVQDLESKIVDAAKDAGLSLGQRGVANLYLYNTSYKPQVAFFRLAHADSVCQKALDLATKDARTKAEQMAKRLNLTLGKAVAVRDFCSRQLNNARQNVAAANTDNSFNELSPTLHNITAEAMVSIEYEILN